jgi:predicted dehydrogenase
MTFAPTGHLANEATVLGQGARRIGTAARSTGKRMAVVGLGHMGARHITALLEAGHTVAGLVDPNPECVGVREHPQLATLRVSSLRDLTPANVDALVIATTAPYHHPLACEAIALGFRRLVLEKPVTQSVADAIDLRNRAEAAGTRIVVNHGRRYCDAYFRVRGLVGEMGPVRSVVLRSGGGALGCVGTHWIDLVTTVIDAEPVRVFATGTQAASNPRGAQFNDPGASLMIEFENGAAAFIDTRDDVGFIGGLAISFAQGELSYTQEFADWTLRRRGLQDRAKPLTQYGLPLVASAFPPSATAASRDATGQVVYSGRTAVLAYARAAYDDVFSDQDVVSGMDAAIQTMRVFTAARKAMETKRSVDVASLTEADVAERYAIP